MHTAVKKKLICTSNTHLTEQHWPGPVTDHTAHLGPSLGTPHELKSLRAVKLQAVEPKHQVNRPYRCRVKEPGDL